MAVDVADHSSFSSSSSSRKTGGCMIRRRREPSRRFSRSCCTVLQLLMVFQVLQQRQHLHHRDYYCSCSVEAFSAAAVARSAASLHLAQLQGLRPRQLRLIRRGPRRSGPRASPRSFPAGGKTDRRDVASFSSGGADGSSAESDPSSPAPVPPSESPVFDWTREWYPLAPVRDLRRDAPNKLTLLGMDVVVWYDAPKARWVAMRDRCPHRLVPLSEGRVETAPTGYGDDGGGIGVIQCPYHGWEFDGDGKCVRIPQMSPSSDGGGQERACSNPRACATSFPARVEQGLLWMFPTPDGEGGSELARSSSPALIPELDDPTIVDATNFYVRDLPYSWDVLVENLCDPSHIPFAHHQMMNGADRYGEVSDQVNMEIVEEGTQGFQARKTPYPTNLGRYDVEFRPPCLLYYAIVDENASSFLGLGNYCVPVAPGRCRLLARFPFKLKFQPVNYMIKKTPRWINHFSQNVVLDSDVVFLSMQDQVLSSDDQRTRPNYFLPAKCDTMVVAFRKWLASQGRGGPKWLGTPSSSPERSSDGEPTAWLRPVKVPARSGRDALLDRYRQHTELCSSCRCAHRWLHAIREICWTVGLGLLCGSAAAAAKPRPSCRLAPALASTAAMFLVAPRLFIRPLIQRLECVPWPRTSWRRPSSKADLRKQKRFYG